MTPRTFAITPPNHRSRGNERRLRIGAAGFSILNKACVPLLAVLIFVPVIHAQGGAQAAQSQNPAIMQCPTPGTQDLITIPEIQSQNGVLRGEIKVTDGLRTIWGSVGIPQAGSTGDSRCASQYLRFFVGEDKAHPQPWPAGPEPMPGPTLRARVGDLVEITFQNLVNTQHFANSLDLGEQGKTPGCDQVFADTRPDWTASKPYRLGATIKPVSNNPSGYVFTATTAGKSGATEPTFPQTPGQTVDDGTVVWTNQQAAKGTSTEIYPGPGGDQMPDCLHGSSTANIHFHGTHTTPSGTGDNVLLYIRPALGPADKHEPSDSFVNTEFAEIFSACEKDGTPKKWDQLPEKWRKNQEDILKKYDATAPYQGHPGTLPHSMQLWPPDAQELANGLWPQYHVGAYPYCFRLTTYNQPYAPGDPPALMGQAPGTHWYHAHKHGSTALNVANGMTGAFIIEGQYDDDLRKFYGPKLREQVMMLQQISSTPFPLLNPANTVAPGGARPPISVNGRRNPVVTMQPGEVQLWRIVNGAFRDAVQFLNFTPGESKQPCNPPGCVSWRQIAQDGVQFDFANYNRMGTPDNQFNLATGNRADLLVKAPTQPGTYVLQALANIASPVAIDTASYSFPLLTVKVTGDPVNMDFIRNKEDFPHLLKELPFLADIPESSIFTKRKLVFGAGNTNIDGRPFNPNQISQAMLLNTAEEWTVMNQANDKSHTFHIHINPFQITEIFQPNSVEATQVGNPCYVDPNNPATFKPCPSQQPQAPYVWWDTFAIPTGQQIVLNGQAPPPPAQPSAPAGGNTPLTPTAPICQKLEDCPVALRPYVQCPPYIKGEPYASNAPYCTELIPGYFKMRSRFVDFTGQYVLHCHILIHEDRGMMELIEVVTDKTLYSHH